MGCLTPPLEKISIRKWEYSQSRYPKGFFNERKTTKDYFGFL
jgi:hypothetical protein